MSHSTSATCLPPVAAALARAAATVVLPSLGRELVTVTVLMGESMDAKRMLASSVLAAFCIADLSEPFLRGMAYLPVLVRGIRPMTGTPSVSSASSTPRIFVFTMSTSTMPATATNRPPRKATAV